MAKISPFQDLYHRGCIILVNFLYCCCRFSAPSPRSIHTPAGRLLTFWANLPSIVRVVPSRRCIESSCDLILPVPRPVSSKVYYFGPLSTLLLSALRSFAPIIHTPADRLLTVWSNLPAIIRVGTSRRLVESSCDWILPVTRPVLLCVYSPGCFPTLFSLVLRSFASIYTYTCGKIIDFPIQPSIHSRGGVLNLLVIWFWPFQDLYHRGCILPVDYLRCWFRCSDPSPRSLHISVGRLLSVWDDLLSIFWVKPLRRRIKYSCGSYFSPFRDLYYWGCTLLVDPLRC